MAEARLVLTRIELENFKSYYGRKVIGPFHKRFSAIVGPNGSGKSNVIDALLFVFGKRASKIRLKKLGELVHNSENHKNCKQARVTIYFQEIFDHEYSNDDYKVVEGSQFSISRVVTKRSQSTYLIDGVQTTRGAVVAKLIAKGIDLNNNRFLILQGEVESISLMKPKAPNEHEDGLLEYLEDIIGSNQYVDQIEKAGEQVEVLDTEVQERLNRAKVVEKDRNKLEAAKHEAEDFVRSELQMWKLSGIQKQLDIRKHEQNVEVATEELEDKEHEYNDVTNDKKKVQEELGQHEEQYLEAKSMREKLHQELTEAKQRYNEIEQQDIALAERYKYVKKETKRIEKSLNNLNTQSEKNQATIEKNEQQIPELQEDVEELSHRLEREEATHEELMQEIADKVQPIREAINSKQTELMPLKDKENQIQQRIDSINDDIEAIEQKATNEANRYEELVQRSQQVQHEIEAKEEELAEKDSLMQRAHNEGQQAHDEREASTENEKRLAESLRVAQMRLSQAQNTFRNQRARHGIVAELLAAQDRKEISGIIGRLGDLGSIAAEYDCAASTAARGPLNNIVVEKTHHAQRAVDYLKRKRLGRATFMMLDKQHENYRNRMNPVNTPRNAPRLFDLVQCKPEHRVCFYAAFRDTLVADSLNDANDLAFSSGRRWRVVTKQGQLIETSGTMSGGGNRPIRGLMSNRRFDGDEVTAEALQQLEREVANISQELAEIRERRANADNICRQSERAADALQLEVRKLHVAVKGLKQRYKDLQNQIEEARPSDAMDEDDQKRLQSLREQKEEMEQSFVEARQDCELLEDEVHQLEQRILESGGAKLRDQKTLVDKLRKTLKAKQKLITKLGVESKKCSKKLTQSESKKKDLEEELQKMEEEKKEIKGKRDELIEQGQAALQSQEEKEEQFAATENEYKQLEQVVKKKEAFLNKLAQQELILQGRLKELQNTVRVCKAKATKLRKEWTNISNRYKRHKIDFLDEEDDEEKKEEQREESGTGTGAEPMDVDEAENSAENSGGPEAMDVDEEDSEGNGNANNDLDVEEYMKDSHVTEMVFLSRTQIEEVFVDRTIPDLDKEVEDLKKFISASKVNMGAIEAYRNKDEEYVRRLHDLRSCKEQREVKVTEFKKLKQERHEKFMGGFKIITSKLKEMYRMLTCGGDAELELLDSIDPFTEGVQFSVRPPKKSWKNISNLSGGEKTLSSMALVFALHHYKPNPLYVMDEIDAALDFKNVSIVANYIKQRTKDAQFIIISLRNNMFELGNRLVGIYKTHDCSKSMTIDPKKFRAPNNSSPGHSNNHLMTQQHVHVNQPLSQMGIATQVHTSIHKSAFMSPGNQSKRSRKSDVVSPAKTDASDTMEESVSMHPIGVDVDVLSQPLEG